VGWVGSDVCILFSCSDGGVGDGSKCTGRLGKKKEGEGGNGSPFLSSLHLRWQDCHAPDMRYPSVCNACFTNSNWMGNKINNRVTHNYHSTQKSIPTEGGRVGKVGGGSLLCLVTSALQSVPQKIGRSKGHLSTHSVASNEGLQRRHLGEETLGSGLDVTLIWRPVGAVLCCYCCVSFGKKVDVKNGD